MRAHAHVEDNIKRLKESGANRFPFTDINANRAWLAVATCSAETAELGNYLNADMQRGAVDRAATGALVGGHELVDGPDARGRERRAEAP